MFEIGISFARERAAPGNVFDLSLGNPEVENACRVSTR